MFTAAHNARLLLKRQQSRQWRLRFDENDTFQFIHGRMRKHGHRKTVTHTGGISSKDPRHTFNPANLDDGKEGGRIQCKEHTEFATERNSTLRTADDNLKARQTLDSICSDKVRKTLSIKCSGIGAVRGTTHVQVSAGVLCIPEEHSSHAHVCNSPDNGFFKTVNALLCDGSGKDLPVEQIAKDLDAVLLDLQQSGRRCCLAKRKKGKTMRLNKADTEKTTGGRENGDLSD